MREVDSERERHDENAAMGKRETLREIWGERREEGERRRRERVERDRGSKGER